MKRGRHLAYRPVSRGWVIPLALVMFLVMGSVAWADNVQNNVTVGGNDTITLGGSTIVNYRVAANSGDGQAGCNASDGSPAVVTINTPAGITASPNPLSFSACGTFLPATFSSTASGSYVITVSVSDPGAGTYNTTPATFTLKVLAPPDSTPPVITPNISGTMGSNGWYVSDVPVSWTVTDPESAITSTSGCLPTTVDVDTAGQVLTCSATSAGGTNSQSVTIKRDATAPTISGSAAPAPNADGWNNSDVTVSFLCGDSTSGIATCGPNQLLSGEAAGQSASGTAFDNAGNSAATTVSGINIDKTAPSISCGSADVLWHATDVAIPCTASDGGSGLADSADASFSLSTNVSAGTETDNAQTGSRLVSDKAGNSATAGPIVGNKVDKKAPSITITAPDAGWPYVLGENVNASYGCTDYGSGVSLCSGPVADGSSFDTSTVGAKTFIVNAEDEVGNQTSSPQPYRVVYASGSCLGAPGRQVLQPINPDGTSVFKKGSTVPVKFRVCDAIGNSIGTPGVVASFRLLSWTNGTTAATFNEEPVSTTPDTAFRWSASDQQWIFNLNTKNLSANYTYTYEIRLNDGTKIEFTFGLK